MSKTHNLNLKLLEYNQAQKEIVINEAIAIFDVLLNKSIISFVDKIPEDKNVGDIYIIEGNHLLIYLNGWRHIKPKEGWVFWVISKNGHYIFQNGEWSFLGQNIYVELIPKKQRVLIGLEDSNLFKVNLSENITISLENKTGQNYKIELALIGENDVEVKWEGNVKWIGIPCINIKKNSYHLIKISCFDGIFLCRNVAF